MSEQSDEEKLKELEPYIGLWKTSLIEVIPEHIWIKGYPIGDLIGNLTFAEMVFLVFKGELPNEKESKLINALLCTVSVPQPPSSPFQISARSIIAGNPEVIPGIIGTLLSVGKYIGRASDEAGEMVVEGLKAMKERGLSIEETAKQIVEDYTSQGKRIPGLGHPIHKIMDPRAKRLRDYAEQIDYVGQHTLLYDAIYKEVLQRRGGRPIALNCDAYCATLLLDLGFSKLSLTPLLLLSVLPGAIASCIEEIEENRPVKGLPRLFWKYEGPPRRELPKKYLER